VTLTPDEIRAMLDRDFATARNPADPNGGRKPTARKASPETTAKRVAALMRGAHKRGFLPGSSTKRCAMCRAIAVKGFDHCIRHSHAARAAAVERRRAKGKPIGTKGQVAHRNIRDLIVRNALPLELTRQPVFQWAMENGTPDKRGWYKDIPKDELMPRLKHRGACAVLARELILAWLALEEGDFKPWNIALGTARELGFSGN
jgi:hypothetical protein